MIIKDMNGAKKEPISTLHQALAFKGSDGDSKITRLNSLKIFDDQPLLAVIGGIKRRKSKAALLNSMYHMFSLLEAYWRSRGGGGGQQL